MTSPLILTTLVTKPGGPFFAPNPPKALLSLLHKGVAFEVREATYGDLRTTWSERFGQKATVPFLELPDGTFVQGSWRIAEWLEKEYPEASSLFLPGAAVPVDHSSPAYTTAKNFALLIEHGLGDSDSTWSTFYEVIAKELQALLPDNGPESDGQYFKSAKKQGGDGAWEKILSLDNAELITRAKASLLPLQAVLAGTPFLAGCEPGYPDYVVYGRYLMMVTCAPALTAGVWAPLQEWIEALEGRYKDGLVDILGRIKRE